MKTRYFTVILKDGTRIDVKAPNKVTLEYARKLAYHWAKVNRNDVINVEIKLNKYENSYLSQKTNEV